MQPSDEGLDGIPFALHKAFHAPVHEIADPAVYPEVLSFTLGRRAEKYSLHPSLYTY
jgi:hypothetical protein